MSRTFVRLYAGVVLFLLILGIVAFTFLRWGQSSFTSKDIEEGFGLGPMLVAESLALSDNPERELDEIRVVYGYDFRIEATASLPKQAASRLAKGSYAVHIEKGDTHWLATLISPETALVLELGQFHQPGTGRYVFAAIVILALLALGLLLFLVPLGKQMRALQSAAETIADGNWTVCVKEEGMSEQRAVAKAFNLMTTRIGEQMEHQRQLFRALSHELRTPLARMRFRVELVEESDSSEQRLEISAALDRDLALINTLVDELLTHARLESGASIKTKRLCLRDELDAIMSERVISERVAVSINIAGEPTLHANSRLFRRALGNLLSNALTYANGAVQINVRVCGEGTEIDIIDDGPGIPKLDRERMFRAFERLAPEGNESGTGLGLAIVEGIVHAHGGYAAVVDSDSGCRVRTLWPAVLP